MEENKPTSSEEQSLDSDLLSKQALGSVVQFIRSTHGFPNVGDDFEFYSSFSGFRDFLTDQKSSLLGVISKLLQNQGLKKNFSSASSDADELTDALVECNDGLLERVSALLDENSGIQKSKDASENPDNVAQKSSVVPATVISSWNKVNKHGKTQTFRLMQAKNILRPQLKFKDVIDNTRNPFVPKIRSKPNATKPLSSGLFLLQGGKPKTPTAISNLIEQARSAIDRDPSIYEHPYKWELEHWEPLPEQLEEVTPQKYKEMDIEACHFIDKLTDLEAMLEDLKSQKEIAVDLEHHSYRSFQGITCLIQISTRASDYIVDPLALRSELQALNEVFTDPRIVKVLHGARSDIGWLQRDFGVYVVNMFDTDEASRILQLERHSLEFLLHHYCSLDVDKKFQLADWRIRPLPKEMIAYAQGDTHYLLYVYDLMKNQLLEMSNGQPQTLVHNLNKSRNLCLLCYEKPLVSPESHFKLLERRKRRGTKMADFNSQQMEALRLIFNWRDQMARQEDESPGYVLPNHMLIQIAEILPREAQGVLACCNPIPPLLRQHVLVVHNLVLDARAKALVKFASSSSNVDSPSVTRVPVPAKHEGQPYTDDILNCPHDLSHGSPVVSFKNQETNTVDKSTPFSSLFGVGFESRSVDNKTSAFNDVKYSSTPSKRKSTPRVTQVQAWDPFMLFMPVELSKEKRRTQSESSLLLDPPDTLSLRYMLSGKFVWKMKTPDHEALVEEPKQENEPKSFGKVVNVPEETHRGTEEQTLILRQMMQRKKRQANGSDKHRPTMSAPAVTFATSRTPDQRIPDASKARTSQRGFVKRAKPAAFTPKHFSDEDYSRFRKKGATKKRKF